MKRVAVSNLCARLESGELQGILLGDSGYPLRRFLMTPYRNPETAAQANFNRIHVQERMHIERAFGELKQRFQALRNGIRLKLERVTTTIYAAFILHNFCKRENDPDFDNERIGEEDDDENDAGSEGGVNEGGSDVAGSVIRDNIAETLA